MARREIKTYVVTDDLTGAEIPDDEAVHIEFSYAGRNYVIDLGKRNAEKFDNLIAPYINAATQVRGNSRTATRAKRSSHHDLNAVREWAAKNGYEVAPRGRVAQTVLDAYDAAN